MGETFEVDEREAWIRHAAALRALARSLISDEHEAEDVVQETWLRFLRTDPGVVREPRTWLSRALRNVSIERFRGRARRRQREELAAQRESVPSSDELLARMELLKRVADHVTALDEPYRSAVHLRYFEGLGVGEIARATGEKLETVRTRLRRGRALLRERLDAQEHGDRDSWCQALAPLAGLGVPELAAAPVAGQPVVPLLGALEMSLRTSLTLALSLALVAGVIWRTTLHSSEPQEVEAVASGADEPFTASPGDELQSGVLPSQEPEAPMREVADVAPAAVVPEEDLAQAPVAGLVSLTGRLVVVDEGGSEHAEENGRLAFHCTSFRGEEWVRAEVRAGAWSCEVPSGARLRVGHVEARGRLALSEDSWVADVDTEGLQVRAA